MSPVFVAMFVMLSLIAICVFVIAAPLAAALRPNLPTVVLSIIFDTKAALVTSAFTACPSEIEISPPKKLL